MVDERNKIKGKSKVVAAPVGEIVYPTLKDVLSTGTLVIREGGKKVDLEEAIKHLDKAKEYQLKARTLLDFSVNIVEPKRKKRKYKKKATVVDENVKKSKVDQYIKSSGEIILGNISHKNEFSSFSKSDNFVCNLSDSILNLLFPSPSHCYGEDDSNIILANPQMISIPIERHDDPYDMFNDYIIDTPANPYLSQDAGTRSEIVLSANVNNQVHFLINLNSFNNKSIYIHDNGCKHVLVYSRNAKYELIGVWNEKHEFCWKLVCKNVNLHE